MTMDDEQTPRGHRPSDCRLADALREELRPSCNEPLAIGNRVN
jgi:hypothetical protein